MTYLVPFTIANIFTILTLPFSFGGCNIMEVARGHFLSFSTGKELTHFWKVSGASPTLSIEAKLMHLRAAASAVDIQGTSYSSGLHGASASSVLGGETSLDTRVIYSLTLTFQFLTRTSRWPLGYGRSPLITAGSGRAPRCHVN